MTGALWVTWVLLLGEPASGATPADPLDIGLAPPRAGCFHGLERDPSAVWYLLELVVDSGGAQAWLGLAEQGVQGKSANPRLPIPVTCFEGTARLGLYDITGQRNALGAEDSELSSRSAVVLLRQAGEQGKRPEPYELYMGDVLSAQDTADRGSESARLRVSPLQRPTTPAFIVPELAVRDLKLQLDGDCGQAIVSGEGGEDRRVPVIAVVETEPGQARLEGCELASAEEEGSASELDLLKALARGDPTEPATPLETVRINGLSVTPSTLRLTVLTSRPHRDVFGQIWRDPGSSTRLREGSGRASGLMEYRPPKLQFLAPAGASVNALVKLGGAHPVSYVQEGSAPRAHDDRQNNPKAWFDGSGVFVVAIQGGEGVAGLATVVDLSTGGRGPDSEEATPRLFRTAARAVEIPRDSVVVAAGMDGEAEPLLALRSGPAQGAQLAAGGVVDGDWQTTACDMASGEASTLRLEGLRRIGDSVLMLADRGLASCELGSGRVTWLLRPSIGRWSRVHFASSGPGPGASFDNGLEVAQDPATGGGPGLVIYGRLTGSAEAPGAWEYTFIDPNGHPLGATTRLPAGVQLVPAPPELADAGVVQVSCQERSFSDHRWTVATLDGTALRTVVPVGLLSRLFQGEDTITAGPCKKDRDHPTAWARFIQADSATLTRVQLSPTENQMVARQHRYQRIGGTASGGQRVLDTRRLDPDVDCLPNQLSTDGAVVVRFDRWGVPWWEVGRGQVRGVSGQQCASEVHMGLPAPGLPELSRDLLATMTIVPTRAPGDTPHRRASSFMVAWQNNSTQVGDMLQSTQLLPGAGPLEEGLWAGILGRLVTSGKLSIYHPSGGVARVGVTGPPPFLASGVYLILAALLGVLAFVLYGTRSFWQERFRAYLAAPQPRFQHHKPIAGRARLFGGVRELCTRLENQISTERVSMVMLVGPPRTGKSSVLAVLQEAMLGREEPHDDRPGVTFQQSTRVHVPVLVNLLSAGGMPRDWTWNDLEALTCRRAFEQLQLLGSVTGVQRVRSLLEGQPLPQQAWTRVTGDDGLMAWLKRAEGKVGVVLMLDEATLFWNDERWRGMTYKLRNLVDMADGRLKCISVSHRNPLVSASSEGSNAANTAAILTLTPLALSDRLALIRQTDEYYVFEEQVARHLAERFEVTAVLQNACGDLAELAADRSYGVQRFLSGITRVRPAHLDAGRDRLTEIEAEWQHLLEEAGQTVTLSCLDGHSWDVPLTDYLSEQTLCPITGCGREGTEAGD